MLIFSSFLWLHNIPLCVYILKISPIHLLMDTWVDRVFEDLFPGSPYVCLLKWDILMLGTDGNNTVEMNRKGDNCQIHRILLNKDDSIIEK